MSTSSDRQVEITVLLCVHNNRPYVREAVDSILGQTFSDFELLVINDASTDGSGDELTSCDDPRIRRIDNETNLGLTRSLNVGLRLARGKYVARMDADDVSLPRRLARQFEFMETHPDVGVCGTWVELTGDRRGRSIRPVDHASAQATLLGGTPLVHPTAMMRMDCVRRHDLYYNESFRVAQDYELWQRFSEVSKLANVPEYLLRYRLHQENASTRHRVLQIEMSEVVHRRSVRRCIAREMTPAEATLHSALVCWARGREKPRRQELVRMGQWIRLLLRQNLETRAYDQRALHEYLVTRWLHTFYRYDGPSWRPLIEAWRDSFPLLCGPRGVHAMLGCVGKAMRVRFRR